MLLIKEVWRRHRKCWERCGGKGSRVSKVKIRTGSTSTSTYHAGVLPSQRHTPIIQNTTPRAEQRPPHGQPSHLTWQTSIHQQSANKTKFFPQRGQAARFDAPMARTPWKGVWDNYGKKHQVFLDHGINLRLGKCILDVLNTFKSIGSFFFGKTVICIYQ